MVLPSYLLDILACIYRQRGVTVLAPQPRICNQSDSLKALILRSFTSTRICLSLNTLQLFVDTASDVLSRSLTRCRKHAGAHGFQEFGNQRQSDYRCVQTFDALLKP
jgi:hypothetical protein